MPTGVVHSAVCDTAVCAVAKTTMSNPAINTSVPVSISFTNSGASIGQAIIDIEIYDANNTRIHQHIVEQQYLPTNETKIFSTSFAPKSTGTHTVKVGVFGSGWSHLYYWTDTAGLIPVALAPAPVPQVAPTIAAPAPTVTATPVATAPSPASVSVWWPANNVSVSGAQPFKSVLDGKNLEDYDMFWQVDGGQLSKMGNSYAEAPHKESWVDVTGWNWRGNGPYVITFVAKTKSNVTLGKKSITVYTQNNGATVPVEPIITSVQPTQPVVVQSVASAVVAPVLTSAGKPLSGQVLYRNTNSPAKAQADAWRNFRPTDAARMDKIAAQPQSQWYGNWNGNIYSDVNNAVTNAKNNGQVPVLVAYNIPLRDCGGWSAGGSGSDTQYKTWIQSFADGIGAAKAVVILEPDALAGMDCLSETDKQKRFDMMTYAVNALKAKGNTTVYIDAGHAFWIAPNTMSALLKKSGIDKADGFSLNVSNFIKTEDNIAYGEKLSALTYNKHFVIDTARNGAGPNGSEWCNPSGRALGQAPTVAHSNPLVDALLWVKTPGESDGSCNGGPAAGQWWGEYALGLAMKAGW